MDFFHDPDVDAARRNDGRLKAGPWILRLPRLLGFCGGVIHAVRTVQEVIEDNPGRHVWMLGEIIHNDTVNNSFRHNGVTILDEDEVTTALPKIQPGDIVVIPAFGVEEDLDRQLRKLNKEMAIVDTTCPKVKHIWDLLEQHAGEKRTIVIHGKPAHPETRATLSRVLHPDNAAILVPDISHSEQLAHAILRNDLTAYPSNLVKHPARIRLDHLALVNQTTMLFNETKKIELILRGAVKERGGTLLSSETVCRATQLRQDAAREVCDDACDLILVIGGYSSSNTTQLYRVASVTAPTYFINNSGCLEKDRISHYVPADQKAVTSHEWLPPPGAKIGLLAGASCPASDIGDVIRRLRELSPSG